MLPRKSTKAVCAIVLFFFLLLKLPMCFAPYNPEELRDFDHYTRASTGEKAYHDFVWVYGPLSPLIYGPLMKFVPKKLVALRLCTLLFWLGTTLLLTLLFARYLSRPLEVVVASLFGTGIIGYASYSHNHVLATLGLVGSVYFWLVYFEENRLRALWASFLFLLLCFFSRPLITGYLLLFGWMGSFLFLSGEPWKRRLFKCLSFVGVGLLSFGLLYLYYGDAVRFGFIPHKWALNPSKGYPNLHSLLALGLIPKEGASLFHWVRLFRVSVETSMFYLHYFIWPGLLLGLLFVLKKRIRIRAAAICLGAALLASADLLHYGFSHPELELALTVRGQFFLSLTLCSFILVMREIRRPWGWQRGLPLAIGALAIGVWSYLPWVSRLYHMAKLEVNPLKVSILQGIFIDRQRADLILAANYINQHCKAGDKAVALGYWPGFRYLTKCEDPFSRDVYAFTRWEWYRFKPGENPYLPEGKEFSGQFLEKRIEELKPKFFLMANSNTHWKHVYCNKESMDYKLVGDSKVPFRVCWNKS